MNRYFGSFDPSWIPLPPDEKEEETKAKSKTGSQGSYIALVNGEKQ